LLLFIHVTSRPSNRRANAHRISSDFSVHDYNYDVLSRRNGNLKKTRCIFWEGGIWEMLLVAILQVQYIATENL
jgi:hypothetical protein